MPRKNLYMFNRHVIFVLIFLIHSWLNPWIRNVDMEGYQYMLNKCWLLSLSQLHLGQSRLIQNSTLLGYHFWSIWPRKLHLCIFINLQAHTWVVVQTLLATGLLKGHSCFQSQALLAEGRNPAGVCYPHQACGVCGIRTSLWWGWWQGRATICLSQKDGWLPLGPQLPWDFPESPSGWPSWEC